MKKLLMSSVVIIAWLTVYHWIGFEPTVIGLLASWKAESILTPTLKLSCSDSTSS